MRCPDDSDQSGKVRIRVLDSDPVTQQLSFWRAKAKLKAAAYRTVRNADPDADAEMQNANNSGSGRGPDLRIVPKLMRMLVDPDSWIRIQEFLWGPQIRIGSVPYDTDPLRIQWGYKLFICKGSLASRASEWTRECYALSPDHTIQVRHLPNSEYHFLLPFLWWSPELIRYGRASIPTRPMSLGLLSECLDAWDKILCR